jgi:hypothetical protein
MITQHARHGSCYHHYGSGRPRVLGPTELQAPISRACPCRLGRSPFKIDRLPNGHEYLKRQLAKCGVVSQALDNGIKSCADPDLLQRLSDELSADKIDRLLRKWLRRLPHPFPARDRAAGYRYQLSILQAEFSLTQVLDQAAEVPMVLRPLQRPHPPLWYGATTPEASVWAARERASIATLVR